MRSSFTHEHSGEQSTGCLRALGEPGQVVLNKYHVVGSINIASYADERKLSTARGEMRNERCALYLASVAHGAIVPETLVSGERTARDVISPLHVCVSREHVLELVNERGW